MKSIYEQQPNQNAAHERCEDTREPTSTGFLRPDEYESGIACNKKNLLPLIIHLFIYNLDLCSILIHMITEWEEKNRIIMADQARHTLFIFNAAFADFRSVCGKVTSIYLETKTL